MSTNRFELAAKALRKNPGVTECIAWSDSVSVRYTGPIFDLFRWARKIDMRMCNIDGLVYAEPHAADTETGRVTDFEPASVVAESESVHDAFRVDGHDEVPRILVTTTGVHDTFGFPEFSAPHGWLITEAKEAQIRLGPLKTTASFLIDRTTSEIRQLEREREKKRAEERWR